MTAANEGMAAAVAGRGPSINEALGELRGLVLHVGAVMRSLSRPSTGLERTVQELAGTAAQVAPVARVAGGSFPAMADTFAAISRHPDALHDSLVEPAPTARLATATFAEQQPLLEDAAALADDLRPALAELRRSLPAVTSALAAGSEPLSRVPMLTDPSTEVLRAAERLAENPSTGLALRTRGRPRPSARR